MKPLYPLKFAPIFKEKIWGGDRLGKLLNKDTSNLKNVGESWEISAIEDNISLVVNGFLAQNNLQELIEVYMGELVGDKVYEQFGLEFPLLIKFIDANDVLSVQVHPDDEMAKERHKAFGKTEMWYVLESDPKAELVVGFNQEISKADYLQKVKEGRLSDILNSERVKEGDCYFIPAGRIHAIGAGSLIAEIQQTSDITYRIFDFNRTDEAGNTRELHTDLAVEAIDYSYHPKYKTTYTEVENQTEQLVACPYFTTNVLPFTKPVNKDYSMLDSFVIYMCVEGSAQIEYAESEDAIRIQKGETVLIPASIDNLILTPFEKTRFLEVFIA